MNNVVIIGLVAYGLIGVICFSLLTYALITTKTDHSSDDALRSRMDSLVNYTEQKINNNTERQDRINNDMETHVRILDTRIKLLQAHNQ